MFKLNIFSFEFNIKRPPTLYELVMFSLIFVAPGLLWWKGYWPFAGLCWPIALFIVSLDHLFHNPNDTNWRGMLIVSLLWAIIWGFVVVAS